MGLPSTEEKAGWFLYVTNCFLTLIGTITIIIVFTSKIKKHMAQWIEIQEALMELSYVECKSRGVLQFLCFEDSR